MSAVSFRGVAIGLLVGAVGAAGCEKASEGRPSSNANLRTLAVSTGELRAAFSSETTSYTVNLSLSVTSLTVAATTEEPSATVTLNGIPLRPGEASRSVPMKGLRKDITIVVTAPDGATQKTYTVAVMRGIALPEPRSLVRHTLWGLLVWSAALLGFLLIYLSARFVRFFWKKDWCQLVASSIPREKRSWFYRALMTKNHFVLKDYFTSRTLFRIPLADIRGAASVACSDVAAWPDLHVARGFEKIRDNANVYRPSHRLWMVVSWSRPSGKKICREVLFFSSEGVAAVTLRKLQERADLVPC